jgi:hypothetical protein
MGQHITACGSWGTDNNIDMKLCWGIQYSSLNHNDIKVARLQIAHEKFESWKWELLNAKWRGQFSEERKLSKISNFSCWEDLYRNEFTYLSRFQSGPEAILTSMTTLVSWLVSYCGYAGTTGQSVLLQEGPVLTASSF